MDIFKRVKNLINRLRGKPKRTPRKILQSHNRNFETYAPQKISTPNVEVDVVEDIPVEVESPHEDFQNKFVIDIKDSAAWENFIGKLNDLHGFKEFLFETPLQWVNVRLDRVRDVLKNLSTPTDFTDDELNFKLAKNVRKVAENMLEILQNTSTTKNLDENSRKKLRNLVEKYLEKIGVDKKNFQRGDSFADWAKLSMQNSFQLIVTDDPDLIGKIVDVDIQPHVIYYVGETGDVEKLIFGGLCTAYK